MFGHLANFVLCYVCGNRAYFTSNSIADQWGDDWNDAPISCNAGDPYAPSVYHYANGENRLSTSDWNLDGTPKFQLFSVPFEYPYDDWATWTSKIVDDNGVSVQDINSGAHPWIKLVNDKNESMNKDIFAGISFPDFVTTITDFGGNVYIPTRGIDAIIYPKPVENAIFHS